MKSRCWLPLAVISLLAATALSQDGKKQRGTATSAGGEAKGPDLRFAEDGADLLVSLMIEGPASRQVVLTDYNFDDGRPRGEETPSFEETLYHPESRDRRPPPEERPRPPRAWLRYCLIIARDLPGFSGGGLLTPRTPPEVRMRERHEVKWRLLGFRNSGVRREDVTFSVEPTRVETSSEQLRRALPKIKKIVEDGDRLRRMPPP
jgi:hypothetical protein